MILPVVFLCLTAVLPPSSGQELEDFNALSTSKVDQQELIVDRHNTLRRGVNPPASNMMKMEWCPPAAENAQKWADQCTLSHSPAGMRRTTVQCGENLFMSSAPFSWTDVIQAWYNEEKDFEYGTGAKTQGAVIGHYTQVVWYSSYQVGCAVAFCPNSKYQYFYVCQYCPIDFIAYVGNVDVSGGIYEVQFRHLTKKENPVVIALMLARTDYAPSFESLKMFIPTALAKSPGFTHSFVKFTALLPANAKLK